MKNKLIAVLLGVSGTFLASAKDFDVTVTGAVQGEDKTVQISVTTTEIHSSMCGLQTTQLEVSNPVLSRVDDVLGIEPVRQIKLKFEQNPNSMCMMAFGPHRGGITLDVGQELPRVTGEYDLIINEANYGKLVVTADGAATLVEVVEEVAQ